jgi:hypothetical protein
MDPKAIAIDTVYQSDVGTAATYRTGSGSEAPVRIREDIDPEVVLEATGGGLRSASHLVRVRVSEVSDPCRGDRVEPPGEVLHVQDRDRLNKYEWLLYVIP